MTIRRLGGILGPGAFLCTWALLGARTRDYSPLADPISRLAAAHAPTQAAMTAGFLAYALGVGAFTTELRRAVPGPAAAAAAVSVVGALGIAATPLDSSLGGAPHAVAAALSYASLAATPLLASPALRARGRTREADLSIAVGALAGAALALSAWGPNELTGLFQRAGLTAGHAWFVAAALRLRRPAGG